jgi:hypothetical protein
LGGTSRMLVVVSGSGNNLGCLGGQSPPFGLPRLGLVVLMAWCVPAILRFWGVFVKLVKVMTCSSFGWELIENGLD